MSRAWRASARRRHGNASALRAQAESCYAVVQPRDRQQSQRIGAPTREGFIADQMTTRLPPIGYWSCSRRDGSLFGRRLDKLHSLLLSELQAQHGHAPIELLQDSETVGARPDEFDVRRMLDKSTFFIPIITPNYIQSAWCCEEVRFFLRRERELFAAHPGLPRRGRIVPIQLLDISTTEPADPTILAELEQRQWLDLREMPHVRPKDPRVRRKLAELAEEILDLLIVEESVGAGDGHRRTESLAERRLDQDAARKERAMLEAALEAHRRAAEAQNYARTGMEATSVERPRSARRTREAPPSIRHRLLESVAWAFGRRPAQSAVSPDPRPASPGKVDFVVVAPPLVRRGDRFALELWVSSAADRAVMLAEATRGGLRERGGRSRVALTLGTAITAELSLPGFEIARDIQSLAWEGDIANLAFIVHAPPSLPVGAHAGSVNVKKGCISFATISFTLSVTIASAPCETPTPVADARTRYVRRAFASYANSDRSEVLRRVQGMSAVGVDVFVDVTKLRAGADWEKQLFSEIDRSDRFFLFWSSNAAKSAYVEKEWRYALARHGLDFIDPLPLEDPRSAAPPPELAAKHFNDVYLAFIAAEEARKAIPGP